MELTYEVNPLWLYLYSAYSCPTTAVKKYMIKALEPGINSPEREFRRVKVTNVRTWDRRRGHLLEEGILVSVQYYVLPIAQCIMTSVI